MCGYLVGLLVDRWHVIRYIVGGFLFVFIFIMALEDRRWMDRKIG